MTFRIESRIKWSTRLDKDNSAVIIDADIHGTHIRKTFDYGTVEMARSNILWTECLLMQKEVVREYEAPALAKGLREWPLWMLERGVENEKNKAC